MKTALECRFSCAICMLAMLLAAPSVVAQDRPQSFELAFTPFLPVRTIQIWDAEAVPGVVYMASPHVSVERVTRMRKAILDYVRDTESGRNFARDLGYGDLTPATAADLAPLAAYGALLKEAQEATQ